MEIDLIKTLQKHLENSYLENYPELRVEQAEDASNLPCLIVYHKDKHLSLYFKENAHLNIKNIIISSGDKEIIVGRYPKYSELLLILKLDEEVNKIL